MSLGGGGGQTIPHTHSAAPQDGGFLVEGTTGFSGGVAGQVLTRSATSIPSWSAAGGGLTTNIQSVSLGSDFTTTSTSAVSTGLTLTATNSAGGVADVLCSGTWWSEPTDDDAYTVLYDDGVAVSNTTRWTEAFDSTLGKQRCGWVFAWAVSTDGSVLDIRAYVVTGATMTIGGPGGGNGVSSFVLSEKY